VDVENIDQAFKISFLCCIQAEIYVLCNNSGLESAILNFYSRSGHKIIPMSELDTVLKDISNDSSQDILFAV